MPRNTLHLTGGAFIRTDRSIAPLQSRRCCFPVLFGGEHASLRAMLVHMQKNATACTPYLHSVMHQGGDDHGRQAQRYEAVLHDLHDDGEDDQVGVKRLEDGAVDVAVLRKRSGGQSAACEESACTALNGSTHLLEPDHGHHHL